MLFLSVFALQAKQPFTIMLDPIGDAKHTGREIDNTFERGITIQFAQALKQHVQHLCPDVRIVLTRVPGETVQPLQNASFANRLEVDFYLTISFYQEETLPAYVAFYYYIEQQTDAWHKYNPFMFYRATQAYLINIHTSQTIGKLFVQECKNAQISSAFEVRPLLGLPVKPLIGVVAPALYLEAGLRSQNDWHLLIEPVATCLQSLATRL